MTLQKHLEDVGKLMGENIKLEGLMKKTGRLKHHAEKAEDVVGFDYIVHWENSCFEYYAANPPLIGITQPVPVQCPIGIEVIKEYKIDYKEAIKIFHKGNWGSQFVSMILSQPLYPQSDPYWYMTSNLGTQVVINAMTGEIVYPG